MFEEYQEVVSRLTEVILLSDARKRDNRWEPLDRDTIAGGLGAGDKDLMAAVVFEGGSNVEAIKSMHCKGASLRRCLMYDDTSTRDSEGSAIKIKVTKEAGMS